MRRRRTFGALLLTLCVPALAAGQGVEGQVGRFYDDVGWDLYRLGYSRPLAGPIAVAYSGSYLARAEGEGGFAGLGLDLTAFRGGQGPYLVAGIDGGLGSPHSQELSSFWGGWSAGAGYELVPASFFRIGVEGRWREISLDHRDGLELGAALCGSRQRRPERPVRHNWGLPPA